MAGQAPGDRKAVVHDTLVRAGLSLQSEGAGCWRSSIDTWGEAVPLVVRLSQHWLELSLDPFFELPKGAPLPDALRRELLRLNRDLRLMKFGVSAAGNIVLSAEMLTERLQASEVEAVLAALGTCLEEHRARLTMLVPTDGK